MASGPRRVYNPEAAHAPPDGGLAGEVTGDYG